MFKKYFKIPVISTVIFITMPVLARVTGAISEEFFLTNKKTFWDLWLASSAACFAVSYTMGSERFRRNFFSFIFSIPIILLAAKILLITNIVPEHDQNKIICYMSAIGCIAAAFLGGVLKLFYFRLKISGGEE
jgi:hypothetical protein